VPLITVNKKCTFTVEGWMPVEMQLVGGRDSGYFSFVEMTVPVIYQKELRTALHL
jgi:hypothetical protein